MIYRIENRNIIKHFIVTDIFSNEIRYMCRTNWSGSYSAGVMEFDTKEAALAASSGRTDSPVLYGFNQFGERVL